MKTLSVTRSNILRNSVDERSVLHGHSMAARMGQPRRPWSVAVLSLQSRLRHGPSGGHLPACNKRCDALVDILGVSCGFNGVFPVAVSHHQETLAHTVHPLERRRFSTCEGVSNHALSDHGFSNLEEAGHVGSEHIVAFATVLLGGFKRILVDVDHDAFEFLINFFTSPWHALRVL